MTISNTLESEEQFIDDRIDAAIATPNHELKVEGDFELNIGGCIPQLVDIANEQSHSGISDFDVALIVHFPDRDSFNAKATYKEADQLRDGTYCYRVTGIDLSGNQISIELFLNSGLFIENGPKGTILNCA